MAHCIHIQSRLIHLSCVRFFFVVFLGRLNVLRRFVALFSHSTNTSCNLAFNVFISVFMSSVTLLSNCCADVFFVCSFYEIERRMKREMHAKTEERNGQRANNNIVHYSNVQRRRYQFLHIIKHCNGFSNTCIESASARLYAFTHLSISLL